MKKFEMPKNNYFDTLETLDCGQVFRFDKTENGYYVLSENKRCEIVDNGDCFQFDCEDENFFKNYFDFQSDYAKIWGNIVDKGYYSTDNDFGSGIRILRQNPIETIFSFVISQNNHIPRIKSIIESICKSLGDDYGSYFSFPNLEKLKQSEDFYKNLGAGYRANFLSDLAKNISYADIDKMSKMGTDELRKKLMEFKGIGRKVADCILLFGFHKTDVFPVDTWIYKIFKDEYPNTPPDKMSKLLVEKYGDHSGFVQQYLFYQKRSEKLRGNTRNRNEKR